MRVLVLAAVLLTGCAVARVTLPNGAECCAIALSQTHARCCAPGTMGSVGGAFTGACVEADGGAVSSTFASIMGALLTAGVAIVAHGGF